MNRGYTRDAVWLRFRLLRTATFPEHSYLSLGPPYLDTVAVYISGGDPADPSGYRMSMVGDHIPVSPTTVGSTDFVVPLDLPQGETATIYLRVGTTSTVTLTGSIQTSSAVISHNNLSILLNGGYLAVALVIVLINLLFYLRLRDRLYLFFACYILFNFTFQLGAVGMLPLILPAQAHLVADYLTGSSSGLSVCFFALFAVRLFDLPVGSRSRLFFRGIFLLGCLTVLSVPLHVYGQVMSVLMISLLVTIAILTGLSIRAVWRNEPGGFLYLAAFGISNAGYAAQFLRLLGLIPTAWWNLHALQMATFCNMVLMTLALTERLHAAEERALQASREAEQRAVVLAEGMTVELRETLERQKRFVAMVTHEYRTPLAIIRSNLDLLQLLNDRDENIAFAVGKMQRAVGRLVEVLEVSLGRVRLADGELTLRKEELELDELCSALISQAREFWPDRQFEVRKGAQGRLCGDSSLLRTALLNLLDNAVKYSPPDRPVTLSWGVSSTDAVVRVEDHGPGIRPGEEARLFEKYYRGSAGSGTVGAGLGLWLVARILEEHGGSVALENTPTGAIGTVRLPVACQNQQGSTG